MTIHIYVDQGVAQDRLAVTCYKDGLVQVDISDDVLVEFRMPGDPTPDTQAIRKVLKKAIGELADALPLNIEGKDFDL